MLIAAEHVLGVRDHQLFAVPPTAPAWMHGIAIENERAVVVAGMEDRRAEPASETTRIVLLHTSSDTLPVAIAIDEVDSFRDESAMTATASVAGRPWAANVDERPDTLLVDAVALTHLVHGGGNT